MSLAQSKYWVFVRDKLMESGPAMQWPDACEYPLGSWMFVPYQQQWYRCCPTSPAPKRPGWHPKEMHEVPKQLQAMALILT